jgi:hypothetical protein
MKVIERHDHLTLRLLHGWCLDIIRDPPRRRKRHQTQNLAGRSFEVDTNFPLTSRPAYPGDRCQMGNRVIGDGRSGFAGEW